MVSELLDGVALFEMPGSLYREAGLLPGPDLRSRDALHLAAAVRIGVDALVTYDAPMTRSARRLGLAVVAPGP
jgi:predicted nucleic acid-binding protein